ncbi:MAG: NAD+ synthase [Planctomycetes bacterium]|nr:NAD+ synthase [Planctomycetota bacterium]
MKISLLQINPTVADLAGNAGLIESAARMAQNSGAELGITPELAIMGYLPRDLLLRPAFVKDAWKALGELAKSLKSCIPVLVGIAQPNRNKVGRPLHNAAVLLAGGKIRQIFHKTLMPTYDVFDEDRYFEPGKGPQILALNRCRLGVSICEDIWNDRDFWRRRRYHDDPIEKVAPRGVRAILNLSSSPFTVGKQALRERMLSSMARRHKKTILYCNQVGGNDDLVFDGRSCVFDGRGRLIARGKAFEPDVVTVDLDAPAEKLEFDNTAPEEEIWKALVMGTRDYLRKCRFEKAVLGLSGGIDSAVTAVIAAEALGPQNVIGVLMPSGYSSKGSLDDSLALAGNLGIRTHTIPISTLMAGFDSALADVFAGRSRDIAEENIQARIRGAILMGISNKFCSLLLTTGNKSELAVGYCTLYGDMNGGLAVIADVPKTMIYRLARWRNATGPVIPQACIDKPPSAELRPNQTDQDSLPPYDLLDQILDLHILEHKGLDEIAAEGFDRQVAARVLNLVKSAEFKRKQAAPGLKVTDRAFGTGWRMPIAKK